MYRFTLRELLGKRSDETGKHITISLLAKELGINRRTLTEIANNHPTVNPGIATLDKLCSHLKCNLNDLVVIENVNPTDS